MGAVSVDISVGEHFSHSTSEKDSATDPKWQLRERSEKTLSSYFTEETINIVVHDVAAGTVLGSGSVSCSAMLAAVGTWVDVEGVVSDSEGRHPLGSFYVRLRFRPTNIPPDEDGYLEIERVKLRKLKKNGEYVVCIVWSARRYMIILKNENCV